MSECTMAYGLRHGVLVAVHGARAPSDEEWEAYLGCAPRRRTRALVITAGGAPNAKQRTQMNAYLTGIEVITAVVADSALVRGAVTAIGWFNPRIRAFPTNKFTDALRYLEVPDALWPSFVTEIKRMQQTLSG